MTGEALRISTAGLRGVVGAGLTAAHVLDFAAAFGTFVEPGRPILLGRDPRASSPMIREGVLAALMACGHAVVDLGVVSTPVLQHAINRADAAGGISIGASHNAADWNALKFFGPRGTYLTTAESGELLDIYHLRKFRFQDWTGMGRVQQNTDALDHYLDDLAQVFDIPALARFRVVVDCCNGTSALILRRLNERFGTAFVLINAEALGQFAHEPAISRQTISLQLAPLMKPLHADAGFLFDLDADRVGLATGEGQPVSEEMLLPLVADYLLPQSAGKLVITNLSTTALVEEVAARHGGRVTRVPVGRQAAMDALSVYRPGDVALAGEGSGAVMMGSFRFVYDGIAAMLAVLSMMRERGQSLAEMVASYPRYVMRKGQVPLASPRLPVLLMQLQEEYREGAIDTSDGLRVDWPDHWFHIRASQTEPVVRVICEQRGEAPQALFDSLIERVRSLA